MTSRREIEAIQLGRYDHLEGDHIGRYGSGLNDKAMMRFEVNTVKDIFEDIGKKPILTLGADAGEVIGALSDNGNFGISVDIAHKRLLGNKKMGKGSFICSRAQELPFANNSIYGVCAFDILEHLIPDDSPKMLEEIYRVLVPGQRVALTTGNTNCLARRARKIIDPTRTVSREDHANEIAYGDLIILLNNASFIDIQSRGVGIIPGMRRIQRIIPFDFLHDLDINLGRNYPEISPEVLFVATKPSKI